MGKNRKKGRQCGNFTSKASQALYQRNFNEEVNEYISERRYNRNSATKSQSQSQMPSFGSKNIIGNQKRPNLTHLQGLLRDRMMEDRNRDSQYRRRLFTVTHYQAPLDNSSSISITSKSNQDMTMRQDRLEKQVGWLLTYNHREEMAGLTQYDEYDPASCKCPRLTQLCLRALAKVIHEYVEALGMEYMTNRIGLMPSNLICDLSALCRNVTDKVAVVLGHHDHLKELVLCGPPLKSLDADEEEIDATLKQGMKFSNMLLTDAAIEAITPTSLCNLERHHEDHEESIQIESSSSSEELESWEREDFDFDEVAMFQGCHELKRLELRNYYTSSARTLLRFVDQCPHITHLCLSGSLNGYSGPEFLLLLKKDGDDRGNDTARTILHLLRGLQVLDLTNCQWMSYDLLKVFLRGVCSTDDYIKHGRCSLDMIVVTGCCPFITEESCNHLNALTGGNPHISLKDYRSRFCSST